MSFNHLNGFTIYEDMQRRIDRLQDEKRELKQERERLIGEVNLMRSATPVVATISQPIKAGLPKQKKLLLLT